MCESLIQAVIFLRCIAAMLRQVQDENLYNRREVLAYIGNQFRSALQLPEWYSAQQVAECLLHHSVCIHLESNKDKFNLIVYVTIILRESYYR